MHRYLPLTRQDRADMLADIGVKSVDDLYRDVPKAARHDAAFDLPSYQGEMAVEQQMAALAARNRAAGKGPFFLGAGCYHHHVPASVDYIIQRSEFMTAYTPYQPEIAQGTLQVIFEYQTMIAQVTAQDIANASLYDGATALAEAALMAMRLTEKRKIVIATPLHPQYREVLDTYLAPLEVTVLTDAGEDTDTAALIVQSPDFFGQPHAYEAYRARCDAVGAKLIVVVTEIVSLGLLPAPALADIVCGEAQSVGLPMSFGGPHLGFFACGQDYVRQMPGRLCGETVDVDGRKSYVLTLSTREQHIRRDKATSNICTNQGLCALAFTVHMALLGEAGFRNLAMLNHARACALADALTSLPGVTLKTQTFFNEFTLTLPRPAQQVTDALLQAHNIIAGLVVGPNDLLIAATEMVSETDIAAFRDALAKVLNE
ncbi:MAG: aminomethyl-transferring glycine dehydrogenase subunit GcvPA [Pseudomonadota bacterium]